MSAKPINKKFFLSGRCIFEKKNFILSWQNMFPKNRWIDFLQKHSNPVAFKNGKEKNNFLRELLNESSLFISDGLVGKAIDRLSLGMVIDKSAFLLKCKKAGIFRHSSYLNIRNPVPGIAKHFIYYSSAFHFTDEERDYFVSLINLEGYYREAQNDYRFITATILKYKTRSAINVLGRKVVVSIVKSLLALNDYAFLFRKSQELQSVDGVRSVQFTLEERSEGISFLISRTSELIGIQNTDLLMINEKFITSGLAERLIESACRFKDFKEMEIDIESFHFVCRKENKVFKLYHPDTHRHQSILLSDIVASTQKDADAISTKDKFVDWRTLKDLGDEIHKAFPKMVELRHHPYTRFRLDIPVPLIEMLVKEPLGSFQEEQVVLEYMEKELSVPFEEVERYEIIAGLTIHDFLIASRAFSLLQTVYSEKLRGLSNDKNYLVVLNSILAVFSEVELVTLLLPALSKDKIVKYLSALSWSAESNEYLDLQYTPIIRTADLYLICLSVMSHSRTLRNLQASQARKGINTKAQQVDLLYLTPSLLKSAFTAQGFKCWTDLRISFAGKFQQQGDLDFTAFKDGCLLIAECKDVLDSVDMFEYRRINDYLIKAASQLTYIREAMKNSEFFADFCQRLGIHPAGVTNIMYVIVPSARKSIGFDIDGFPVRNVHEFTGFIYYGKLLLHIPNEPIYDFHLWKGDKFDITDLITFCNSNSHHQFFFDGMQPVWEDVAPGYQLLKYGLEMYTVQERLKANYRFSVTDESKEDEIRDDEL